MNNIEMLNVPSDCRFFCLINYNAFAEVVDKDGKRNFIDLPQLKPIFAPSLKAAKLQLAEMLKVDISDMTKWESFGDEDGFCPSLCIGYKVGALEANYSFDVYTTVNTIHLLEA